MVRIVAIVICVAYWLALTTLLLAPNPAELLGLRGAPDFPLGDKGVHFSVFAGLSMLSCSVRWPKRPTVAMIVLLMTYAVATESLQVFVPTRSIELFDYAANFLGLLTGLAAYSAVCWLRRDSPPADVVDEWLRARQRR